MQTTSPATISALILAGRRPAKDDPLAGYEGAPHKALLEAGGKALIARVGAALAATPSVGPIRVAAPGDLAAPLSAALAPVADCRLIAAGPSPATTIASALEEDWAGAGLLVAASDHALLSPQMVSAFLDGARGAQAAAGCVERRVYEARFPHSRRTFITLKDFSFSGANLFWFAGARAQGLARYWRRLEANRKNPLAMAAEIGPGAALAYLSGQMTKASLETLIREKTGAEARLVALPMPEAAIDVDKPEDLALVRRLIEARDPAPAPSP